MCRHSFQAVRILKAGAAGAILALALIHVLGDSFTDFGGLPADAGNPTVLSYPWAALCMLASIIFMVILEHILNVSHMQEAGHSHSHRAAELDTNTALTKAPLLTQDSDDIESTLCAHTHATATAGHGPNPGPCSHGHSQQVVVLQEQPDGSNHHSSAAGLPSGGAHAHAHAHGSATSHQHPQRTGAGQHGQQKLIAMGGAVATAAMAMAKGHKQQQRKPQPHGHIHVDHHESAHGGKCTHHLPGEHHRSLATRSPHGAEASRLTGQRSEYSPPGEQAVIVHGSAAPPQPHSHSHAPPNPKHLHADHADQHQGEHSGQASHTTPDPGTQHPHQHAAPSAPGASSSHRDCGACADHHGRHHTPQALSGAVCCTTAKGGGAACCDTAASDCAAPDVVLCLAHTHSSSLGFEPPNLCSSDSDNNNVHAHDAAAGYQGRGTCGDGGEQHGHLCPDSQADRWLHSDAQHPTVNGGPHVAAHRAMVVAYLMEVGCVFHSVIIGIDLGLGMDSRTRTITR
ncbi:MAG: hypothetical protein WDW36_000346 [Sanguina aurantia]